MDATMTAQDAAENISDGINCLHAITMNITCEDGEAATLSRMRAGLALIRSGVGLTYSSVKVNEAMIDDLDKVIEMLGGLGNDEASKERIRDAARRYIQVLSVEWNGGKPFAAP